MNIRPEPSHFPAAPGLRERVEQAIESLLQLLDAIDGDADLEPALGSPEASLPECVRYLGDTIPDTTQERWAAGHGDELELDPGDDGRSGRPARRRTGLRSSF